MHCRIIQLDNKPIPKEKLIDECTFDCSDFADYVTELEDRSEKNRIREIKDNFSGGRLNDIFSVSDDGTVIFEGLTNEVIEGVRGGIQTKANEFAQGIASANNASAYDKDSLTKLTNALNDPLQAGLDRYVVYGEFYPSQSIELLEWLIAKQETGELKKGDTIYIGAILDFHY